MTIKLASSNIQKVLGLAVFLFCLFLFQSCEKEIKINITEGEPRVVIEGAIENDVPPFVLITKSLGFFGKVDLATIEENFIHEALVIISDGTITDTLREYSADTGGAAKFFFYSVDTTTLGNAIIVGEFNKTYKLSVTINGKTYEASTKIPSVPVIDKFGGEKSRAFKTSRTPENAVGLYIGIKDPDTLGNYFRYFTKRNNEPYYPVGAESAEELGTNGKYFDTLQIGFGFSRADTAAASTNPLWGDSITLKWCAIDKQSYDFWNTYEFAINVVGNPFASPINLPTVFTNGALGVWCGYGATIISIQGYHE
jgi:hypothetical protein